MKKVFTIVTMLLIILTSTGVAFAAENGVEAKANDRNPAFEVMEMDDMGGMVVHTSNEDLHFSRMHGHIMIPGNAGANTNSPIFKSMDHHEGSHIEPSGRIPQFGHGMH